MYGVWYGQERKRRKKDMAGRRERYGGKKDTSAGKYNDMAGEHAWCGARARGEKDMAGEV